MNAVDVSPGRICASCHDGEKGGDAWNVCSSAPHAGVIVKLAVRLRDIDGHKVDKAVSYQRSSDANKLSN